MIELLKQVFGDNDFTRIIDELQNLQPVEIIGSHWVYRDATDEDAQWYRREDVDEVIDRAISRAISTATDPHNGRSEPTSSPIDRLIGRIFPE